MILWSPCTTDQVTRIYITIFNQYYYLKCYHTIPEVGLLLPILWIRPSHSRQFPPIRFSILLLLRSQLFLWGSPFLFFCVPSYISGVHHSPSSSAFPAISLGFTILLLRLRSQLYLWGSPFFFFFCVPSYISWVHHSSSSSSAFPPISLRFIILLLLLLRSQLYLWGSPFLFFFCVPSYISGVHHSSSSSVFPAISLWFTILSETFAYVTVF